MPTPEIEKMAHQTILSSLFKRVGDIAEPDFIALPDDTLVGIAVKTMRERDVSSILVSQAGSRVWNSRVNNVENALPGSSLSHHSLPQAGDIIGILTERDFLYRVMAENRGPYKVTIGQVMSSPLITIGENATVRDAIVLMQSKQIRRLPVIKADGRVIGLVTLKTVIGNMPSHNIDLAEVEYARGVADREDVCPYCRSIIGRQDSMAGHMEGSHMQKS